MREILQSYSSVYSAVVRVALKREHVGFRDTGDNVVTSDIVSPTTFFVLNDTDYDRARAVVKQVETEWQSTPATQVTSSSPPAYRFLARLYIGLIALILLDVLFLFIREAVRAYRS